MPPGKWLRDRMDVTFGRERGRGSPGRKQIAMANSKVTKRWTAEEIDRLRSLLDAGKTAREIAVEIDRTPNAIHGLLQRHYRKQDPQRPDETRRG